MARKKRAPVASPTISGTLKAIIEARDLSGYRVAKDAGVQPHVVNRFLKGERGLSMESLDRVCAALRLRLVEDPPVE